MMDRTAALASSNCWRKLAQGMRSGIGGNGRSTGARYSGEYATAGFVTFGAYVLQEDYVTDQAVRKALQAKA